LQFTVDRMHAHLIEEVSVVSISEV